ncbi:MAG: hypothetical protein ACM3U2_02215 [Deltaproteobacteria bacterium]
MRSFRPYLRYRPELATPPKLREEYSPDELAGFQAEFKRRWKRRKRLAVPCLVGFGVWAAGTLANLFVGGDRHGEYTLLLMLLFLAVIAYLAIFLRFPRCPACTNEIDEYPSEYWRFCPACGGTAIEAGTWLRAPQCPSCGTLRKGKGRDYRVRFCTTCGVKLDDGGV